MSKEDNGGPAFPEARVAGEHGDYWTEHTPGMTLRDYFAAKALFWVMNEYNSKRENEAFEFASAIARDCYRLADAMLKERNK